MSSSTTLVLFLAFCLPFIYGQTFTGQCTVTSSGCLGGMTVKSTYIKDTSTCRDTIIYSFTTGPSGCDISNFVLNIGPFGPADISGCNSGSGSSGINKNFCYDLFTSTFNYPYKMDVSSAAGCAGNATVTLVMPTGQPTNVSIGLKGGQDCAVCTVLGYLPLTRSMDCSTDPSCDDNDACTVDTCSGPPCNLCFHERSNSLCMGCLNDTACADQPYIDECTYWTCNTTNGICEKRTITGCVPCELDSDCPVIADDDHSCIQNVCRDNVCVQETKEECCVVTETQTVDACYVCTQKFGCGYDDSGRSCVALNATTSTNITTGGNNCSVYHKEEGDGGLEDGEIAGIVVPVVVATLLGLLAAGTLVLAIVMLILKKMQKGAIVAQLQSLGFSDEEANAICNNAIYKNASSGNNPFFITTDDAGNRVIMNNGGHIM